MNKTLVSPTSWFDRVVPYQVSRRWQTLGYVQSGASAARANQRDDFVGAETNAGRKGHGVVARLCGGYQLRRAYRWQKTRGLV